MQPVSCRRRRFLPEIIRLAAWLYFRFTTSPAACATTTGSIFRSIILIMLRKILLWNPIVPIGGALRVFPLPVGAH